MVRKLKALLAPEYWRIEKKEQYWVYSPSPGPHKKFECIPLAILLRNVLGIAESGREAEKIIKRGEVMVDCRVVKDFRFPTGLFDTISIPKIDKYYRIVPFSKGLKPVEISEEEAKIKICKIVNKTAVKNGKIQLNLHDGKNILFENSVKTQDSLLLELPSLKVLDVLKFEIGNYVVSKIGNSGIIKSYNEKTKILEFEDENSKYSTKIDYVYVVGREKPLITIK